MGYAILVGDPLCSIGIITNQKPIAWHLHRLVSFSLQEMNVQHLFPFVVMLNGRSPCSSIGHATVSLKPQYISTRYIYSYIT